MRSARTWTVVPIVMLAAALAEAQPLDARVEVGAHVAVAGSNVFDASDVGLGGRVTWLPHRLIGIEGALTFYPSDYPDGSAPFSSARWEAFFGGTAGPRFGRTRVFARLRPGILRYQEAPAPIACIQIFPPPLACTLAEGATVFALDLGGGVEVAIGPRTTARIDIGDRMLRYDGPVTRPGGERRADGFWTHAARVGVGIGLRF